MNGNDTVSLLKECDSGTKMAVSSIDDVLDRIKSSEMRDMLVKSRENHEKLGNEIHSQLIEHGSEEKDPNAMAKGMSWLKTTMKMSMGESDGTVADLLTDGCNMGIKSLNKYLNEYDTADQTSKGICKKLISIEEELCRDLKQYL